MDKDELLLRRAAHELRELRQRNQILQAKADVLDLFSHAFYGPRAQGYAEDVAASLDRRAAEIEQEKPEEN